MNLYLIKNQIRKPSAAMIKITQRYWMMKANTPKRMAIKMIQPMHPQPSWLSSTQ
jgi:hypothetical protein